MINNNVRYECCPLCHSENVFMVGNVAYDQPIYFSTHEIELKFIPELWKCSRCYSFFVQNVVPEGLAVNLYSQGKSQERWSTKLFQDQKPINQLHYLKRFLLEGRKVLDIGCNTGALLDYAKSLGCETAGVEFSQNSRQILEGKGHIAFSSMSDVQQRFDVITAFDLVEHIYDMPAFFINCKNMLKKGGILIVVTGNIESLSAKLCKQRWWYFRFPEHIAFPSKTYFIHYSGFLVEEWIRTYASIDFQFSWSQALKWLTGSVVRGSYNGLPSIGPDHVLAVMQNEA